MRLTTSLAACGAAALLTVTGCSSGTLPLFSGTAGTVQPAAASAPAGYTPGGYAPGGVGAPAGAGSATVTGSKSMPAGGVSSLSWAPALGAGVQVTAPPMVTAGNDSPADVVAGLYDAYLSNQPAKVCGYYLPSLRATCAKQLRSQGWAPLGSGTSLSIGFVAVKGAKALVTLGGTVCEGYSAGCYPMPADAGFTGGHSFDKLWKQITNSGRGGSLMPCAEVAGKWYIDSTAF